MVERVWIVSAAVVVLPYIGLWLAYRLRNASGEVILAITAILSIFAQIAWWWIKGPEVWPLLTTKEWLIVQATHLVGFTIPVLILLIGVGFVNTDKERSERIVKGEEKI